MLCPVIVLFGVASNFIYSILRIYVNNISRISNGFPNKETLIQLIWTVTPASMLNFIAITFFLHSWRLGLYW